MIFSKQDFCKPQGIKTLQVPLADGFIVIRELTAQELLALNKKHGAEGNTAHTPFAFDLAAACVIDEQGNPLFNDGEDAATNFRVSVGFLTDLADKIVKLSSVPVKN